MKKFKFSVVIPIYNVEDYLEETIESVINQTIGFEDNIQMILVNDGSPDNSEMICLKYKELYPENIIYIKQKNAGVSAARNNGLKHAEGEFVNFLDSDDKWSKDVFKETYNFYKKHKDLNIFSFRMRFFGGRKGKHPLNFKYLKNTIVDIREKPTYIQLSSSSIIIKTELAKKFSYQSSIKYSEDNRFINEMILLEEKYACLSKPTYYYRRRLDYSSAIQNQTSNVDWYLNTTENVYLYLCDYSKKIYGEVIEYIKQLIFYEIQWRIPELGITVLSNKEQKEYHKIMDKLLNIIDDEIILNNKKMVFNKKIFLLNTKYKKNFFNDIEYLNDKLGSIKLFEYKTHQKLVGILIFDNAYINNNTLSLYGKLDRKYVGEKEFKVKKDNKVIKVKYYELTLDYDEKTYNNEKVYDYIGIRIDINLEENGTIKFYKNDIELIPRFKKYSIFYESMPYSNKKHKNKLISYHKKELRIQNQNWLKKFYYELRNNVFLIIHKKWKVSLIRMMIPILKLFKTKKIMLVSDRVNKADDNGEHFYIYMKKNHPEIKTYFILSKKSVDYDRMKKYGNILDNNSKKYKVLFQIADYIVSSQGENYVFDILGRNNKFVQDLYDFKYIFLQHGIIKDDLSPWLNVNQKRIDMFVTSAPAEYNSLLKCKYYYGPEIVKMTGLPRYDTLLEKSNKIEKKKQILVSCTWRNKLASKVDKKTGERLYNEGFKKSEYFNFLNNLFNDKKLHCILKEYNYTIKFIPHPNVMPQLQDFVGNDLVKIETGTVNYQKEFCENSLLITDYSSIFYDFAYLNKPVVYVQYDREEFFEGQLYNEGYFDYKKMGFGPVCEDYDTTINTIINIIKNNCVIEKKYQKRIDTFFGYHDKKNCERVYKEIMKK